MADPGFPHPPWPGVRRLGPFLTPEEALSQAVSDAAGGHGVALGVYDDAASETLRENPKAKVAALFPPSEIKRRGTAEARRRVKLAQTEALDQIDRDALLEKILPEGVTVADLREQGAIK